MQLSERARERLRTIASRAAWMFRAKISYGLGLPAFLRLLVRNRFVLGMARLPVAALSAYLSAFNSGLAIINWFVFSTKLRETELQHDPLFILGHWRSGTTYLHELISCDERFAAPKGYHCFLPGHFLVSESTLKPVARLFLPRSRPMDAMVLDLDRPQEDEYAMLGLLGRSTNGWFLFPRTSDGDRAYLSLRDLGAGERAKWIDHWLKFLKSVSLRSGPDRRLVLKSPQHTARVRTILEVFPRAQFVHISRDPPALLRSTLRTWRAMAEEYGLQSDGNEEEHLKENILRDFSEMYRCYSEDRSLIPNGHLVEVKYEDLASNPIRTIKFIYQELKLGNISEFEESMEHILDNKWRTEGGKVTKKQFTSQKTEQKIAIYREMFGHPRRHAEGHLSEGHGK